MALSAYTVEVLVFAAGDDEWADAHRLIDRLDPKPRPVTEAEFRFEVPGNPPTAAEAVAWTEKLLTELTGDDSWRGTVEVRPLGDDSGSTHSPQTSQS